MKNNLWRFLAKSLCVCCVLAAAFALQFTLTEKTDAQPVLFTQADAAIYYGECGAGYYDKVYCTVDTTTGVLNITGSGYMSNFYSGWDTYRGNIKTINIADGVTSIADGAFDDFNVLTSITIPDSVTSIGSYAFENCSSLKSIKIPEGVVSIENSAFSGCSSLTSITIPDSVTSIGSYAFENCSRLTSITISDSVTSIGDGAFYGCSSLKSITIPDSVTSIGAYAFENCSSLTSITISDSVTSIGDYAFYGCISLTSIEIPDSVISIGEYAFYDCKRLKSIELPDSLIEISDTVFCGCSGLTSIELPDGVMSIGEGAFEYCSKLTSILIPDSVIDIGLFAFYGCSSLSDVYYTGTEDEWDDIIIDGGNSPLVKANIHFNVVCRHTFKTYTTTKATISKNGSIITKCSICGEQKSKTTIYKPTTFTLSTTTYTYDGKVKTPTVTIKTNNGETLKKDTDYTLTYASGRKNVGTYNVTVKMIGNYSGTKTLSFKIVPKATSKITVSKTTSSLKATWSAVSDVTGYKVFLFNDGNFVRSKIVSSNVTSYTFSDLISGTAYTVRVQAYKALNNTNYLSAIKSYTTATLLQATSKITVNKTASSIKATWNKVSGVTGYKVFLYKGSTLVRSKVVSSNVTSYTFSELISGTAYTVKVQAYKKLNNTNYWSAVKSYTTATLPKTTSKITVTQTTVSIKATWSKVSGVSGYKVSIYKGSTLIKSKTLSSSSSSCTFTGLVSGTKYTVKVQAYKNLNNTTYYSAVKSISTATKPATTSITSLKAGTKSATVKWKNISGESGYQVYYATSKNGTYKLGATLKANDIDTTIKSLTTGKTYYFKVRAYTKTDSGTVYSAFSSVKSVKVK